MSRPLVVRWYHVAPAVLAVVLMGAWAAWRALESRESAPAESTEFAGPEPEREPLLPPGVSDASEAVDFPRQMVSLFWPRADGSGLMAVEAEIFATQRVTDRAKQIVELLLRGPVPAATDEVSDDEEPAADAPDQEPQFLAPLPVGTRLRAAFVDGGGTAYVSLSSELTQGGLAGSTRELAAAYSVVNSLVRSLPEINSVQFLVEGREVESIGGHLDARFPLVFNDAVVALPPEES